MHDSPYSLSRITKLFTLPPNPSALQALLTQFHARYPVSSLVSELLAIHQGSYVVRALVQLGGQTVATAMATAADIELAEDRAKQRVLEALGVQPQAAESSSFQSFRYDPQPSGTDNPQNQALNLSAGAVSSPKPASLLSNPASPLPEATLPEAVVSPVTPAAPAAAIESAFSVPGIELPLGESIASPVSDLFTAINSESSARSENTSFEADLPPLMEPDSESREWSELALAEDPLANLTPEAEAAPPLVKPSKSSKRKTDISKPAATPTPASTDRSEEIARIGVEMKRLGWTTEQGRSYLKQTYGKRSRQELDDSELLDFLSYLASQPSPLQSPF